MKIYVLSGTSPLGFPTRSVVLEESILEREFRLLSLTPRALVVEVDVGALLVFVGDGFRLLVSLEPREVLFVEAPRLAFQFSRGKVSTESGCRGGVGW